MLDDVVFDSRRPRNLLWKIHETYTETYSAQFLHFGVASQTFVAGINRILTDSL